MPSARFSLVAAVLAGVLALASASTSLLLAGGIAVIQVVFALGVVRSSGLRSARPAAWLGLAAGIGALAWIESNATTSLAPVAAVLGPTLLIAFVAQLLRRDGRLGLNATLSLIVTACVMTVLPVLWLSLRATAEGVHTVGLALLGVGAVGLVEALPISRAVRRVLGVVVASIGSALLVAGVESVGQAVPAVSAVVISAFAGVMAGVAFAVVDRMAGEASPTEEPVLVTVPDDSSQRAGEVEGRRGDVAGYPSPAEAAGSRGGREHPDGEYGDEGSRAPEATSAGMASIVPLRVTAPFVAAAPTAYVLGQLLIS